MHQFIVNDFILQKGIRFVGSLLLLSHILMSSAKIKYVSCVQRLKFKGFYDFGFCYCLRLIYNIYI